MDQASIVDRLESRFGSVEEVRPGVLQANEMFEGRKYAVRYFQLHADVFDIAKRLNQYQEDLMGETYFAPEVPGDLRWNHYLYLLIDVDSVDSSKELRSAKAQIEGDRAYSRKMVLTENEFEKMLSEEPVEVSSGLPLDVSNQWVRNLDERGLSFILDDQISAPQSARLIKEGHEEKFVPSSDLAELSEPESAAGRRFLDTLEIESFRSHPSEKTFKFGAVNLIFGANGVGKTSLLEAIEYLYCGENKRNGEVQKGITVRGKFIGSDEPVVTSSSTKAATLRARNAHWYSKIDVRKSTLMESFGKFNFLDTDAAVHLSTANDSDDRLKNDIARLLLGTEVEKLSNKLSRVGEKLKEEIRYSDKTLDLDHKQLETVKARLESESNAPQISDGIFSDLCQILKNCRWLAIPKSKSSSADLREALRSASLAAKEIETMPSEEVNLEPGLISEMIVEHELNLEEAENLSKQIKKFMFDENDARRQEENLRAGVSRIKSLTEYARSGYTKKRSDKSALRDRLENMREKLSLVDFEFAGLPEELDLEIELPKAYQSSLEKVDELRGRVTSLSGEVRTIESTMESVTVLKQRLLSAASELISSTRDPEHCPLCRTRFEAEELEKRMGSKLNSVEEKVLLDAHNRLNNASKSLAKEEHLSSMLKKLMKFVEPQLHLTTRQAVKVLEETASALGQAEKDLSRLEEDLKYLEEKGLSESDLHKLLFESELEALPNLENLTSMLGSLEDSLEKNFAYQEKIRTDLSAAREKISKLTDMPTDSEEDLQNLKIRHLRERVSSLNLLHSSVIALDSVLDDFRSIEKASLNQKLEQAKGLAERLELAVKSELHSDQTVRKLKDEISTLDSRLKIEESARSRLIETESLIEDMVSQVKEGTLSDQVLRSNAADIGNIFSTIHAPNEFKVDVSSGGSLNLTRVGSNNHVSLMQMSTGQRAAYALSLFLSMNKSLLAGPPVILMDDPIAHVDDLNMLSFLDHLRDIAISGSRQIFLATADAKLAGLFRQKFRFLGESAFREFKLSR
tara:strand:- start:1651 stop:4734 length:3084 start_codon:yes stop_codon:yes gene_type:complete